VKMTVFGASGGTGRILVERAAADGHAVTAVVRDAGRAPGGGLDVVVADVMDPDAIAGAVAGRDVVISALGMRPGSREPVCAPGAASVVTAMRAAGVRRLVVVTAAGHVADPGDGPVTRTVVKPILGRVLRHAFADFRRTEEIVTGSGLDWTIVRPPRLTDGRRRPYRTALDRTVGATISRGDLADAVLAAAADPGTIRHAVGVGY
jgi:putative NADH-flavin reductase